MSYISGGMVALTCSVFIAISLDGFIARKNGGLDWLPGSDGAAGSGDYGYGEFFASIDTLVMGRNTYEAALSFQEWPYRGKKVIVLSSRFPKERIELAKGAEGSSMPPAELCDQLASTGSRHIYVDGGKTIQSFLRAGLIHDMTITRVPILLGAGIPLFGEWERDIRLKHITTRSFENGLVQSTYAVI